MNQLDFGADCNGQAPATTAACREEGRFQPAESTPISFLMPAGAKSEPGKKPARLLVLGCAAQAAMIRMFWIYGGYQYMIGVKGANQQSVTTWQCRDHNSCINVIPFWIS